jgi:aldose 1-epimerase
MMGRYWEQATTLVHGDSTVVVSLCGGSLLAWTHRGINLLRPTALPATNPTEVACFPMVPYVNRIANGNFRFAGQPVQLAPNVTGHRHSLHGQAWLAQWKRSGGSVDSLILSWDGGGNEWPWPYHVDQSVRVGADTLELEMHVTNRSDFPAPLDLGWHPYFPAASQATLRARTEHVWLTDSEHLPTRIAPVPEGWKFDHPRTLVAAGIDNSFVGWDGAAELTWPHHSISMQSVGCTHLHVFAPTPDDSVCIEPQTAAPTALNRGGLEVHVAAPGERISISTRFKVVHAL